MSATTVARAGTMRRRGMSAAAALARVERAGLRLRIDQDDEVAMEGPPPPPGLLDELRTCWPRVVRLLKLRAALDIPPAPGWLDGIAAAIHAALAAGAKQEADEAGWFYLSGPGDQRLVVAPDTIRLIVEAGLLLPLAQAPAEGAEVAAGAFYRIRLKSRNDTESGFLASSLYMRRLIVFRRFSTVSRSVRWRAEKRGLIAGSRDAVLCRASIGCYQQGNSHARPRSPVPERSVW
jgi:hypothetical protein